jgi:hypothetical protein
VLIVLSVWCGTDFVSVSMIFLFYSLDLIVIFFSLYYVKGVVVGK